MYVFHSCWHVCFLLNFNVVVFAGACVVLSALLRRCCHCVLLPLFLLLQVLVLLLLLRLPLLLFPLLRLRLWLLLLLLLLMLAAGC